jgi:hypothetical protein
LVKLGPDKDFFRQQTLNMQSSNRALLWAIGIAVLFAGVLIATYFLHFRSLAVANDLPPYSLSSDHTVWGTFGDYIGGVIGTSCNLLGVLLLYLTFRAQMANSNLQQFETTFFNLLANQRDIVKGLSGEVNFFNINMYEWQLDLFTSDNYIEKAADELEMLYMNSAKVAHDKTMLLPEDEIIIEIDEKYQLFLRGKEAELDHYFRHLYHIVKYTDEAAIINKRKYVDIIQAQMSDKELYLAFYNGIALHGRKRFLPLMNKYDFIENVRSREGSFDLLKAFFYPDND